MVPQFTKFVGKCSPMCVSILVLTFFCCPSKCRPCWSDWPSIIIILVVVSELQIRGGIENNSKIIKGNICCDPSLEPSQRDGSNDGTQNMFQWRNIDNYP